MERKSNMFHHKCAQIQKKCWKIILVGDMASMSILVYYCHHQNLSVNVWRNFGAFHSTVFLWNFPLTICTDWWSDGYSQTKRLISLPDSTITITHMKKNKNERMERKNPTKFFSPFIFFLSLFFRLAHKAKWSIWWTCSHFLTFSEWLHTFISICWWS